ncbi:hypothetical protein [Arenibacter sp. S6351L]|uniref:hypothetical protein n=1 Tax=Arenibacter sp. S6351L TaxID=2926407 RepID=UPI001FF25122|nr:hypothetical protein [Arenibacter sp. S6351L]MCK0137377.1 hypothetical protein [Arenibacter sp. S6351L]
MEQKTLKYLRVFIPGFVLLLGLYPIYNHYYSEVLDIKGLHVMYISFISLLLGAVYYQLNIQRLITNPSHYFITKNILDKLISAYGKEVTKEQRKTLLYKEAYMTTFYKVIDNDESLKRKGENVKFNGIFWTSTADIALIFFVLYFIYKCFFKDIENVESIISFLLYTSIIAFVLHLISVKKHINLSNKQLDPIVNDKELSSIVKKRFDDILK